MSIPFADSIEKLEVISTGLFLDKLTGVGGIPRGRITEIWGDESVGKTTICLHLIVSAQKLGLRCLFVDTEWSFEPAYATFLGVDNSKLGIVREELGEHSLDIMEAAIRSGEWDLVVLDSVGGLLPKKVAESSAGDKNIAPQAQLVSDFWRRIVPQLVIKNVAFVALNHFYIDMMNHGAVVIKGGKTLRYHKSISIRLQKKHGVSPVSKESGKKVGKVITGIVKKNKVAGTEGLEVDGHIIFGRGFSASADLLDDAIEKEVITKLGNTLYFGDIKLGVGMGKARKMIEEDPVLAEKIKDALNEKENSIIPPSRV